MFKMFVSIHLSSEITDILLEKKHVCQNNFDVT